MTQVLDVIEKVGILPLIVLNDVDKAVPLGKALVEGGIPIAEVTFRTENAASVIQEMSKVPNLWVGAGTVNSVEQAKTAIESGASFIVTPGINALVVEYCQSVGVPIVPGVVVPSDIELGIQYGLETLKFFPAETYGGIDTLKAFSGPFQNIKFVPTGGVNLNNLNAYLSQKNVSAVGGSFVPSNAMVQDNNWDGITKACKAIRNQVLNFKIKHVGINPDNSTAENIVSELTNLFDYDVTEHNSCYFVGDLFEIMKNPYLGKNGHIAISTSNIERAMYYWKEKGYSFNPEATKYNAKGEINVIYLNEEVGGFAIHLIQE